MSARSHKGTREKEHEEYWHCEMALLLPFQEDCAGYNSCMKSNLCVNMQMGNLSLKHNVGHFLMEIYEGDLLSSKERENVMLHFTAA